MGEDGTGRAERVATLEQFQNTVLASLVLTAGAAPRATIKPVLPPEAAGIGALQTGVHLLESIGEGGMGVVRLAEQRPLGREVAVKTLRAEERSPRAIGRLVREACAAAIVEHPNVVPLYALELDERGVPLVVMKRIEGASWGSLLDDAAHPMLPADPDERRAWHLEVLTRVCDALGYAHSRGILHLDVKPDNVMIGRFREIYLVDWGLAVSVRPEHRGRLRTVDEVDSVVGTPAYLAPEMVQRDSRGPVSERTDVYLLGATLYHVLMGSPPHTGRSVAEVLFAAYRSEPPPFDDAVPEPLVAIVRRAMHPEPAERFASAEALRDAVLGFLGHRGALRLIELGRATGGRLREAIARAPLDAPLGREAHRLFDEARFALREALRSWPESEEAARALADLLACMAEAHLVRDATSAAAAVLVEVPSVTAEQAARLEALQARVAERAEKLHALAREGRESDVTRGMAWRAVVLMLGVLLVNAYAGALWWREGTAALDWNMVIRVGVVQLVVVVLAVALFWRKLAPNRAGRRIASSLLAVSAMLLAQRLMLRSLGGIDPHRAITIDLILLSGCLATMAITIDLTFLAGTGIMLASALLCVLWPAHTVGWSLGGTTLGVLPVALAWMRAARRADRGAG
jgi:serine/threonine-protein kinase